MSQRAREKYPACMWRANRQISSKLDHDYGITMRFTTQADYDAYSAHPQHSAFVEQRWLAEVTAFQEADFAALD